MPASLSCMTIAEGIFKAEDERLPMLSGSSFRAWRGLIPMCSNSHDFYITKGTMDSWAALWSLREGEGDFKESLRFLIWEIFRSTAFICASIRSTMRPTCSKQAIAFQCISVFQLVSVLQALDCTYPCHAHKKDPVVNNYNDAKVQLLNAIKMIEV